jgi:hypothetical protein
MTMYEVFDDFLASLTWYRGEPGDQKLFYFALATVVERDDFDPVKLGNYIREKKGLVNPVDHPEPDIEIPFSHAVERLVHEAWAIRGYLKAMPELEAIHTLRERFKS